MTSILKDKKVLEYFGCPDASCGRGDLCPFVALRVIQAMEEPIKIDDKYLHNNYGEWEVETHLGYGTGWPEFHPFSLRLPSKFQKQTEEKECPCDMTCRACHLQEPAPVDPVEEKIKEIKKCSQHAGFTGDVVWMPIYKLNALVSLAKRQAKGE